jgi:toxin ParE1/3/4
VRVRWLRAAVENLCEEAEYIARDDPEAAAKLVAAIVKSVCYLADYPSMGRAGRVMGTRELVVPGTPYIVPYRVREREVQVLRVFHGARKWPDRY